MRNLEIIFGIVIAILASIIVLAVAVLAIYAVIVVERKSNENCAVLAPPQGYISVHNERSGELV